MHFLYNIAVNTAEKLLPVSGWFSEKMKLFVEGRKEVFLSLKKELSTEDETIWFHAASLGEYEQAVPVMERLKEHFPKKKIVVTFFSPSGYEVKKNTSLADVTVYLPLDTRSNVQQFLELVQPEWALFIKYEFWPNYLQELRKRKIKTLLISGAFREEQAFFKPYGSWMRSYLETFDHFFVQNLKSAELLKKIGFKNVTLSGDTRFDRVSQQISHDNHLDFIEEFKDNKLCIVAGSTWPEDEELLIDFINASSEEVKFIIAPHAIKTEKIKKLQERLKRKTITYSEKAQGNLSQYSVFIIDTVGLLSKIYSYADIAYVGGAAGNTGLHNILEPATFGLPIVIGNNYSRFPEAHELHRLAGLFTVANKQELQEIMLKLVNDEDFRRKTGLISEHFINSNTGATNIISDYIQKKS